ncbi:MAG: hypothetical protein ACKOET_06020 [Verrucomicrobiota bacterium]
MKTCFARWAAISLLLGVGQPLQAGPVPPARAGVALLASRWKVRPTEHLVLAGGVVLLGLALWRRARHPHP